MNIILEGIVGSTAYGLETENSDIDIKGIMVYPTEKILSLQKGKETVNSFNPDKEYHEVEKFIRLATKCNPSILELLYLDSYLKKTIEGEMLISIREAFLSKIIYHSYGGYAIQQAKKLYIRAQRDNTHTRHEKHSRHCFRLLFQGAELLQTGKLTVKLENPQVFFDISKMPLDKMISLFEEKYAEFKNIKSSIPDKPNYDIINHTLIKIRNMNLG